MQFSVRLGSREKEVSAEATISYERSCKFQNKVPAQFGFAVLSIDLLLKGLHKIVLFSTKMPNILMNISQY